MTVFQLRAAGYRVYVRHLRFYRINVPLAGTDIAVPVVNSSPSPRSDIQALNGLVNGKIEALARGGRTEVEIYRGETLIGAGVAKCSSKDAYSKKIGRTIALGRAVRNLNLLENPMAAVTCNWSSIIEQVGAENVRLFATRQMTARKFESLSSETRKLVREFGTETLRTRARQALSRRSLV